MFDRLAALPVKFPINDVAVNIPTFALVPSAKPDDLPEVLPVNLVAVTTPATILFPL